MWATLAFALSLAAGAPTAAQGGDVPQLVRDACVGTGLDRAAFERLGRERRWRRVEMTRGGGDRSWIVAFRAEGATVMLMGGSTPTAEAADMSSCSFSVERAPDDLEEQVGDLASALGLMPDGTAEVSSGMVPIRIWSRFGDSTLTLATAPDGRAVISFSRQHVTYVADQPPVN